ncbi:molecular chaperone HtpG [Nonomuraea gerenzanensis]|uniref:Chaperone protein HtpG n=1 Tax=Nonomuraea gerenzanensis TaxID=93944 RepID=A0A1M4EA52_9ACTN|nr:molecular chaperone HtpG [Nonomuraea gerenzanensis]UBU17888.1 molecular chaperone HtpG [Nonomuraea gerenzanensis]SBO95680.1 Chaperone protein HtpG [Nonomuraea gerenzanensis]
MTLEANTEKFTFQAEVARILDLMAHSLYSKKEIFLRELISNASDAIDRLRFERFSRADLAEDDGEPLRIRVAYDKDARTITVSDNGVGMSRAEVIENIGTIARSGTAEFLEALSREQRGDSSLIGQFGVGFYSAFVVAERVELTTRRAGLAAGEGVRWESDGKGEYVVETVDRPDRGTTIVLHLREGEDDLLNGYRLRSIIQRYSDHISLPIVMAAEDESAQAEETTVNQASALWTRPKSELSERDYHDYYRHVSHDYTDPLAYLHSKVEGRYEYTLLLYIPSRAPYDLWVPQARQGVKLHVQRVFILEDSGELLPRYLRFVRGVIDSADLPLNVSRELLQGSRAVSHICSSAVKKVLKLLNDLARNEPDKYAVFWKEFGAVLKEGIADDPPNREEIAELLRFTSTRSAGQEADVSLQDYVDRMKEGQDKIYYLLAPTLAAATASPHLEAFRKKGVEVLLLGEAVDNWLVTGLLQEFGGKRLQSVTQGVPDFGGLEDEAEKEAASKASAEYAALLGKLKEILAGTAYDVRMSSRLTTSPACIVANEAETDFTLARRMRGSGLPSQPVLELNAEHVLVKRLNERQDDPRLADWAHVLFGQAVLTLGARIDDPASFADRLNGLLVALTEDGTTG